jgi:hypothetical protein
MKTATVYIFPMRKKECVWEVIRLRAKGEFLCKISAADEKMALKLAVKQFQLKAWDEKRLIARRAD